MADTQEARKIWQALEKPITALTKEKTQSAIRSKKMTVVALPDENGLVEVRDAFSPSCLLPYDKGALKEEKFVVGKSVLVYWYQNDFSTAIISKHGDGTEDTEEYSYTLPVATGANLGGIQADQKETTDTTPARIGTDNKLYVTIPPAPQIPDVKIFTNITSSVFSDNADANYPYQAVLACPGITEDYFADVVFPANIASDGMISPVCETSANAVTIYSMRDYGTVTASSILCVKAVGT